MGFLSDVLSSATDSINGLSDSIQDVIDTPVGGFSDSGGDGSITQPGMISVPAEDDSYNIRGEWKFHIFNYDDSVSIENAYGATVIKEVIYGDKFSPILKVTFELTPENVFKISNNLTNLLVRVTQTRNKYSKAQKANPHEDEPTIQEVIFDTVFVPLVDTEDLGHLTGYEDESTGAEPKDISEGRQNYNVRFYLQSIDYSKMYKKSFNHVLSGPEGKTITVPAALQFILENTDCKQYIVDPVDNAIPFEYILLPSGNVNFTLKNLQMLYGIYYNSLSTFYDYDGTLYVLSRYSKTHEVAEGKLKHCHIKTAITDSGAGGIDDGGINYDDKGSIANINLNQSVNRVSEEVSAGEADGDSIIFTNYGIGREAVIYSPKGKLVDTKPVMREYLRAAKSHEATGHGISYDYDELNNAFNVFSELASKGLTTSVTVASANLDPDILNPNVGFSIEAIGDDPEANIPFEGKSYSLLGYTQTFKRVRDTDVYISEEAFELIELGEPSSE